MATAHYLIFCDPAPTGLGLRTRVELLHINSISSDANEFRLAGKPHVFLNKSGFDVGPITTELIPVVSDVTLEGASGRGFRLYVCIADTPCVGEEINPLQATATGGHALLNGFVRLGDQNQLCADYLEAMLSQEEANLDSGTPTDATSRAVPTNQPLNALSQDGITKNKKSPKKRSEKSVTAAVIKKLLNR